MNVFLAAAAALVLWMVLRFFALPALITARLAGLDVGLFEVTAMRFRRIDPARVLYPAVTAKKAGLEPDLVQLEMHGLAGGNIHDVVTALVYAAKTGLPVTFEQVAAIDLSGRDPVQAIRERAAPPPTA